jgi:hypothetical protein
VPGCVEPKTRQLIALAQDGEASALEQLCRVYGERVRRIVRLRLPRDLRPKLDSVDLVQDVLLGALGGLVDFTYRDEGDFLRWLARITENKIHDHMDNGLPRSETYAGSGRWALAGPPRNGAAGARQGSFRPPRRVRSSSDMKSWTNSKEHSMNSSLSTERSSF